MKAWIVDSYHPDEWYLIFADTRTQAKQMGAEEMGADYIEMRARRCGGMDDMPDTDENRLNAGLAIECLECGKWIHRADAIADSYGYSCAQCKNGADR